jgi:hypothetical protein
MPQAVESGAARKALGHAIPHLATHMLPLAAAFIASVSDLLDRPDGDRESNELSVTCARLLAQPSGATRAGNVVELGRHSVATTVEIERVQQPPNRSPTIAEVRVRLDVDGQPVPALTTRSVGIDATRRRALEAALEDWTTLYGRTIADALTERSTARQVGAFAVYAGPAGSHDSRRERALAEANETFLREIEPVLSRIAAETSLHTVSVLIMQSEGGPHDGAVLFDDESSQQLKSIGMKVDWPNGGDTVKQYYVLVPMDVR